MISNHRPLVRAIVEAISFVQSVPDEVVSQDMAVRCLEGIASELLQLGEGDQAELRKDFLEIADAAEDPEYRVFVRSLADDIGLAGAHQ